MTSGSAARARSDRAFGEATGVVDSFRCGGLSHGSIVSLRCSDEAARRAVVDAPERIEAVDDPTAPRLGAKAAEATNVAAPATKASFISSASECVARSASEASWWVAPAALLSRPFDVRG